MQLQPLSPEALRRLAPSIYAEQPFHTMSDRYAFVPTYREGSAMRKAARQWTGSPLIPAKWRPRSKYQPHYGEQAAARNRSRM